MLPFSHRKPFFESNRLQFFQPTEHDRAFLHTCCTDPYIMQFQGDVMDETRLKNFFQDTESHWAQHGFGRFIVVSKKEKQPIGFVSLKYLSAEDKIPDLGFALLQQFCGKGFATEAAQALIAYARNELKLQSLQALNNPENQAGSHVLEKLGFVRVGTIELEYLGRNYGTAVRWVLEN